MLRLMRNLGRLLLLATPLSLLATTAFAAPTVALAPQPTPVVIRVDSKGAPYSCPERNAQAQSCIVDGTTQGIGYHDCIGDTSLGFNLTMTGVPDPNYNLQIWAGTTDCTQPGATNNATTGTCWKVAQDPTPTVVLSLDVRVADVVSALGVSLPPQTYTAADATTACNQAKAASTGVSNVSIYFMVFANGGNGAAPVSSASYPVKVKLTGPAAVTGVTASPGDGEIVLGWTPPPGDPTLQGFDLFAVPQGTTLGDGGAATCNGTSGSVDVSTIACPSGDGGAAVCQVVAGATAGSGSVSGLAGNTTYVAAVAPFDEYGNEGAVAQAACATPSPSDGGSGTPSSGGCSCEAAGGSDSRFALGLASAGLAALVLARRRKRRPTAG